MMHDVGNKRTAGKGEACCLCARASQLQQDAHGRVSGPLCSLIVLAVLPDWFVPQKHRVICNGEGSSQTPFPSQISGREHSTATNQQP